MTKKFIKKLVIYSLFPSFYIFSVENNQVEYLHKAIVEGNIERVRTITTKNKNIIDISDEYGLTSIHIAVLHAQVEIIDLLLTLGASANNTDKLGLFPFHYLAFIGENTLVQFYKNSGLVIKDEHQYKFSNSSSVSEETYSRIVSLLLQKNATINVQDANRKISPLHCAVYHRNVSLTKVLLNNKANPNSKDINGNTPLNDILLICDVDEASILLIKLLIDAGAHTNNENNQGNTPLFRALELGENEVVKMFIEAQPKLINKPNKDGLTALHVAAREENWEALEILIKFDAIINHKDNEGNTPLHYAVRGVSTYKQFSPLTSVQLLILSKAKLNAQNNLGISPLHWAADLEVVRFLIESGAFVNIKDNEGSTPFHEAVIAEDLPCIQLLLESGANVNSKTHLGVTALHIAAFKGNLRIVKFLVKAGATANQRDDQGILPHQYATSFGHKALADYLLRLPQL